MASRLNINATKVNESWLESWHEHHGIHFKAVHREARECPDFSQWLEVMLHILNKYEPSHVLNADETALFYRMTGNKTFVLENESNIRGRKQRKARVTTITCVTMAGDRFLLTCIGAAKTPR